MASYQDLQAKPKIEARRQSDEAPKAQPKRPAPKPQPAPKPLFKDWAAI